MKVQEFFYMFDCLIWWNVNCNWNNIAACISDTSCSWSACTQRERDRKREREKEGESGRGESQLLCARPPPCPVSPTYIRKPSRVYAQPLHLLCYAASPRLLFGRTRTFNEIGPQPSARNIVLILILLVDGLAFWKEFMMHSTSVIHENRTHHLLFRLKTTWFFRSRLIEWTPFTRLMSGVRVILINPRLSTSNYPFDERWVGVDLEKYVFRDINAIPSLHEIQVFRHQLCRDASEAQIFNQNVLNGSVSNVQLLCNLSYGQFEAHGHPPFHFVDVFISFRCRRPATAFVILDRLTTTSEAFVPAENVRSP